MNQKIKKALAGVFSVIMLLQLGLMPTLAEAIGKLSENTVCPHHLEHTEACGYIEEIKGTECSHMHNADCAYIPAVEEMICNKGCIDTNGDGVIRHAEGCAYAPAVPEKPCKHLHDTSCGYTQGVNGSPCTFHPKDCEICSASQPPVPPPCDGSQGCTHPTCSACNPQESNSGASPEAQKPEVPLCICTEKCTSANIHTGCPICGKEDTDLVNCLGQEPPREKPPALLTRPFNELTSSDVILYFNEDFDSYIWEKNSNRGWEQLPQTGKELRLSKADYVFNSYRCYLKKGERSYYSEIHNAPVRTMYRRAEYRSGVQLSDESSYMKYAVPWLTRLTRTAFNLSGKYKDGTVFQTTYKDGGYSTVAQVEGHELDLFDTSDWQPIGGGLFLKCEYDLISGGRFLRVTYRIENRGSRTIDFSVGSSGDIMIDKDDYAPIRATGKDRLTMTGKTYDFNLIVPEANTLWFGYYSLRFHSLFTGNNMSNVAEPFRGDSSVSYSWNGSLAPNEKWAKHAYVGVGEIAEEPILNLSANMLPDKTLVDTPYLISGRVNIASDIFALLPDGEEVLLAANMTGNFSGTITFDQSTPRGKQSVQIYAISKAGGLSDRIYLNTTILQNPLVVLKENSDSILEETSTPAGGWEQYFKGYVKDSSGDVVVNLGGFNINKVGSYTIIYTASREGMPNATAKLTMNVISRPLNLTKPTAVKNGSAFAFSANLTHTGAEPIVETGFVWGSMPSPTILICNGKAKTPSPIATKGGTITLNTNDIIPGIQYYLRAYAIADGNIFYSTETTFGDNTASLGIFSVTNNGNNSFTVTLTNGIGEQTVYYRTVNGSAIGGTHFAHQSGALTFGEGETSKTVTITEYSANSQYGNSATTKYTNANRSYELELYRTVGGAEIRTGKARRSMWANPIYKINRSVYDFNTANSISTELSIYENPSQGYNHTVNIEGLEAPAFNWTVYSTQQMRDYIRSTAKNIKVQLHGFAANDQGWRTFRYVLFNTAPYGYFDSNKTAQTIPNLPATSKYVLIYAREVDISSYETTSYTLPKPKNTILGTGESSRLNYRVFDVKKAPGQPDNFVLYEFDETCHIALGAYNSAPLNSRFMFRNATLKTSPNDIREPALLGVAPMAQTQYRQGESITIALVFDEIVDSVNSNLSTVSIQTNVAGSMRYAGGENTNLLYFTGTVTDDFTGGNINVSSITSRGNIKDMCGGGTQGSGNEGNTNIDIDSAKTPVITISESQTENTVSSAKISALNADILHYQWSENESIPINGWFRMNSGETVSHKKTTTGNLYLHALAINKESGITDYKKATFIYTADDIKPPFLDATVDNSNWAISREIFLTKYPPDATVSVKTPNGTIETVAANSYTADQMGNYTFSLTSGKDKVVKTVSVSKLDGKKPEITITGLAEGVYPDAISVKVSTIDIGISGIASVSGIWRSGSEIKPATGLSVTGGTVVSPNTAGAWTLTVTAVDRAGNSSTKASAAYTIVTDKPSVAVQLIRTAPNGAQTYSYQVTAPPGVQIASINLPSGNVDKTQTSGELTLTVAGTYYVTVTDTIGHIVLSDPMVLQSNADRTAPEIRLSASPDGWTKDSVTVTAAISDNIEAVNAIWRKKDSSASESFPLTVDDAAKIGVRAKKGSFDVKENGTYLITATDASGNSASAEITLDQIDKAAPTVTLGTIAPEWQQNPVAVTVSYMDSDSGIKSAKYAIVNSKQGTPSALTDLPVSESSITVSQNGISYLYYRVEDYAGNISTGYSQEIKVDALAPALTITGGTSGAQALALDVDKAFGASGGNVTVSRNGGAAQQIIGDEYLVASKGTYAFTAVSGAGKATAKTVVVYEMIFDSEVPQQLVVSGGKATMPNPPVKAGHTFQSWQKNNIVYDFNTAVTSNLALTANWSLNQPTVTVTASPESGEAPYSGNTAVTLTANSAHAASGVSYAYQWYQNNRALGGETRRTLALSDAADSSSYTVEVTAHKNGLSASRLSDVKEVVIHKAAPSISVDVKRKDRNLLTRMFANILGDHSDTFTVVATVTGVNGEVVAGQIQFKNGSSDLGRAVSVINGSATYDFVNPNASTHNITAVFTPSPIGTGMNYQPKTSEVYSFSVDKAEQAALAIQAVEEKTYGDSAFPLATSGGSGTGAVTFESSNASIISINGSTATVSGAGSAVITAKKAADDNFNEITATLSVTVHKKEITPSVGAVSSKIYDKTAQAQGSIRLIGVNGETPVATARFVFTDVFAGKNKIVHVAEITLDGEWGKNYRLSVTALNNIPTAAEIEPKEVALVWSGHENLVYTGQMVHVTATAAELIEGDSCAVTVTGNNGLNAGIYTATATALSNRNYKLPPSPTLQYTITKAEISFQVSENEHTYDAADKTAAVTQSENEIPLPTDGFSISYRKNQGTINGPSMAQARDAGKYDIIVTLTNDTFSFKGQAAAVRELKVGDLTIHPKPIDALWQNLYHTYDGAAKTARFTLTGIEQADQANVDVILSGNESKTDAGYYTVKATLNGQRAANYTLTNSVGRLIISKAPIIFTVSDNSYLFDQAPHTATVTADRQGISFNVSYYKDGKLVQAPTEAGVYDIVAEISDSNYRHADTTDGTAQKIGIVSIYEQHKPATYTVSFRGGEGAQGTMPDTVATHAQSIHVLPDCSYTKTGYSFIGWSYNGEVYQAYETIVQPAGNVTLTALWEADAYRIDGVVDQQGNPAPNCVITLMCGSEFIKETKTDNNGIYQFEGITPGLYNLVASKSGIIMTVQVEIMNQNKSMETIMLPSGKTNSVVDVIAGTPAVVVGNLEKVFDQTDSDIFTEQDKQMAASGGTVEIRLTVEKIIDDSSFAKNSSGAIGLYLDMNLYKTLTKKEDIAGESSALSESNVLLESIIYLPGELQKKHQYTVYREHNGIVDTLTQTPNANGEYFKVNHNKTMLTIYSKKFSSYAVGYTAYSEGSSDSDNGTEDETPVAPPIKRPSQRPIESQIEQPSEQPIQIPIELPAQKPLEEPIQKPLEKPTAVSTEPPIERTPDQPTEEQFMVDTEENSPRPFVVLSAAFWLVGILFTIILWRKRRLKKSRVISALASVLSTCVFLMTSGFNGITVVNIWTMVIAVSTIISLALPIKVREEND